jgi:hypothetical protein
LEIVPSSIAPEKTAASSIRPDILNCRVVLKNYILDQIICSRMQYKTLKRRILTWNLKIVNFQQWNYTRHFISDVRLIGNLDAFKNLFLWTTMQTGDKILICKTS